MRRRTHLLVLALACAASLSDAPGALAHAQLTGTSPVSGAVVQTQPQQVIFKFNQAVGGTLGAVRVYDAAGDEVDNLDVTHPDGRGHWMGVGLKPHLPDGTYTATYRVISADTHIVYGGLVFSVGHPGPAPRFTVAGLIAHNQSGEITEVAFGVVRGLNYLSIALFVGGLAFLLAVWLRALAAVADRREPRWASASSAFRRRLWLLLTGAVALGVLVGVLGILLQGASAAGVSFWSSLKGAVIENTLESRFGEAWALKIAVWLVLGGLLLALRGARRESVASRAVLGLMCLGGLYLATTPALAGHASIESPTGLFFPADVLHVLAASVWVGGIACLLLALPAATGELEPPDRTRLLLATLARFSPLALGAVLAIVATGAVQAYIDVRSVDGLLHTTYGTLILIKVVLVLALVSLGWVNRARVLPALRLVLRAGDSPGRTGVRARRTMRGEIALMLVVFGVTAALVSYTPPIDAASGPFSTTTTLGPIELEMTVEPAKTGLNTAHLYLINAKDGTQFTGTKELTATAELPAKGIGPLSLRPTQAGPGHFILDAAELSPGGTWELELTDRVSEFEQYSRTVKVPIH